MNIILVSILSENIIDNVYIIYIISLTNIQDILPFVVFSLVEGWIVPHEYQLPPMVMFIIDLLCIIPISFYIGMAVSR